MLDSLIRIGIARDYQKKIEIVSMLIEIFKITKNFTFNSRARKSNVKMAKINTFFPWPNWVSRGRPDAHLAKSLQRFFTSLCKVNASDKVEKRDAFAIL